MEQNVLPVLSGTVLFIVVCIKKKTWMSWKLSICSVAYIDFIQDGCYFFLSYCGRTVFGEIEGKTLGRKKRYTVGLELAPCRSPGLY